jgi:hypothetical protein
VRRTPSTFSYFLPIVTMFRALPDPNVKREEPLHLATAQGIVLDSDDMALCIMGYLRVIDLCNVAGVSTRWRRLAGDARCWQCLAYPLQKEVDELPMIHRAYALFRRTIRDCLVASWSAVEDVVATMPALRKVYIAHATANNDSMERAFSKCGSTVHSITIGQVAMDMDAATSASPGHHWVINGNVAHLNMARLLLCIATFCPNLRHFSTIESVPITDVEWKVLADGCPRLDDIRVTTGTLAPTLLDATFSRLHIGEDAARALVPRLRFAVLFNDAVWPTLRVLAVQTNAPMELTGLLATTCPRLEELNVCVGVWSDMHHRQQQTDLLRLNATQAGTLRSLSLHNWPAAALASTAREVAKLGAPLRVLFLQISPVVAATFADDMRPLLEACTGLETLELRNSHATAPMEVGSSDAFFFDVGQHLDALRTLHVDVLRASRQSEAYVRAGCPQLTRLLFGHQSIRTLHYVQQRRYTVRAMKLAGFRRRFRRHRRQLIKPPKPHNHARFLEVVLAASRAPTFKSAQREWMRLHSWFVHDSDVAQRCACGADDDITSAAIFFNPYTGARLQLSDQCADLLANAYLPALVTDALADLGNPLLSTLDIVDAALGCRIITADEHAQCLQNNGGDKHDDLEMRIALGFGTRVAMCSECERPCASRFYVAPAKYGYFYVAPAKYGYSMRDDDLKWPPPKQSKASSRYVCQASEETHPYDVYMFNEEHLAGPYIQK